VDEGCVNSEGYALLERLNRLIIAVRRSITTRGKAQLCL
jgi:hypothetical protein